MLLNFIKMLLGNGLGQRFKALTDNRGINSKAVFVFLHLVNQEERFQTILAGHHHLSLIVTVEVAGNHHAVIHADTRHSGNVVLPPPETYPDKAVHLAADRR
jgi:hypothetical protein